MLVSFDSVLLIFFIFYFSDSSFSFPSKEGFVVSGIYYLFDSPMYGVGNLTGYGLALIYLSTPALFASAICHVSIYLFNFVIEQPFVRRAYQRVPQEERNTIE